MHSARSEGRDAILIGGERKVHMAAAVSNVLGESEVRVELTEDLHLLPRQAARVTVAVDKKVMNEQQRVVWAVKSKTLIAPSVDDRRIKIVLQGISHQQNALLVKNRLRKETISIPAGTIIGTVSAHKSVTQALKHGQLFDEDDQDSVSLVREAKECECRGELQSQEETPLTSQELESEVSSTWIWRPMRVIAAATILLVWIVYSFGITLSDNHSHIVGSIQASED